MDAKKLSALQHSPAIEPAHRRPELTPPPDQEKLEGKADAISITREQAHKAIAQEPGVMPFPSEIKKPLKAKDVLPKKKMKLRAELQDSYQGTLTYSGERLDNGNVKVNFTVQLSDHPKKEFSVTLAPEELKSFDNLYNMLLEKVASYVFEYEDQKTRFAYDSQNQEPGKEQHGLQEGDFMRIKEMARDIIETFTGNDVSV